MQASAKPTARLFIVNTPPLAPADIPPLDLAHLDDFLMDFEAMDADSCPPDMCFDLGDRQAWVYDHGNVADLVFVRTPPLEF